MSCLDEHRIPNTLPPIFEEETQMSVLTRAARHTRFVLLAVGAARGLDRQILDGQRPADPQPFECKPPHRWRRRRRATLLKLHIT